MPTFAAATSDGGGLFLMVHTSEQVTGNRSVKQCGVCRCPFALSHLIKESMAKKNSFAHPAKDYNAGKRHEKKMKIFDQSFEVDVLPDDFAVSVLDACVPDWIPLDFYMEIIECLCGFTPEMALIIADDVVDCWSGLGLNVTGLKHVDDMLGRLYMQILDCAHREGITLEYWK